MDTEQLPNIIDGKRDHFRINTHLKTKTSAHTLTISCLHQLSIAILGRGPGYHGDLWALNRDGGGVWHVAGDVRWGRQTVCSTQTNRLTHLYSYIYPNKCEDSLSVIRNEMRKCMQVKLNCIHIKQCCGGKPFNQKQMPLLTLIYNMLIKYTSGPECKQRQ